MSTSKMIALESSDGETFEVEEAVAVQSLTIKHMIEDDCANTAIPLPNVSGKILAKVIEYCRKHAGDGKAESEEKTAAKSELEDFDKEFVKVDQDDLFHIILAANFLNIKGLLDVTCQAAADMIKDRSPEYVRKLFNITNDFTPEEEAELREEHAWSFEGVLDD